MASAVTGVLLAALIVTGLVSPSCAETFTAAGTLTKLRELGFPLDLLTKAHITDLSAFGSFTELDPYIDETGVEVKTLHGFRTLKDLTSEFVNLSFYEFPDANTGQAAVTRLMASDHDAVNNPDFDVFYFLDATGTKAFKALRMHPIDDATAEGTVD